MSSCISAVLARPRISFLKKFVIPFEITQRWNLASVWAHDLRIYRTQSRVRIHVNRISRHYQYRPGGKRKVRNDEVNNLVVPPKGVHDPWKHLNHTASGC